MVWQKTLASFAWKKLDSIPAYKIFSLGDSAVTIDFGNQINDQVNKQVINLFQQFSAAPFEGMIEAVPAYSSLTIFYNFFLLRSKLDPNILVCDWVKKRVEEKLFEIVPGEESQPLIHHIPVCYDEEFGTDLARLSEEKNLSISEIIQIHCSKKYRVYMLGFLPGFAYMGEVDDRIVAGRKAQPTQIIAGSVGIAGKQTGIYPLNSPGGWQIVGRTPKKLFDPLKSESCLLKAGDEVEFYSITKDEFKNSQSRNS